MKKIFLWLLMVLPVTGFSQQYKITAELTGFPEHARFILKDLAAGLNIDSAEMTDNKISLSGNADEPKFYWLYTKNGQQFYYTILLMGSDTLSISGNAADFPYYLTITGSPSHDLFQISQAGVAGLDLERDSLIQIALPLLEKQDSVSKALSRKLLRQVKVIDSSTVIIRKKFVAAYLNSYAGLSELYFLKNEYSKQEIHQMLSGLHPEFRESSFGRRVINYLKVGDIIKKGELFYDFEALDSKGIKQRLSSLKGKYILLDFTETYCGPCVQSAADLRQLAASYAGQLAIVSFYADPGKETWMAGIKRDKPSWLTLWDGKGLYSETVMKYGVTGYPSFFLIDPAGKIIEIWSGYGKTESGRGSLEEAVDKVLKNK